MLYDGMFCRNAGLSLIDQSVTYIKEHFSLISEEARIGIILGSGLGDFADRLENKKSISFSEIPHFPKSTVAGHKGNLVWGKVGSIPIFVMQGRIHFYEGHSLEDVTYPVRLLKKLGVQTLIVTNAAGIINKSYKPGNFMVLQDHINLLGHNPLRGKNWDDWGPRFSDMSQAYDPNLRKLAKKVARKTKLKLKSGVYVAVPGPSYETPAEIKMLRRLGADAVGMSTVPEVIVANHQGTKVCGISCLTNYAARPSHHKLGHEEVLETSKRVSEKFGHFLREFIITMSS